MTTEVHELGGVKYSVMDLSRRTVKQDHFLLAVFRRTGVDKVTMPVDEDPRDFLIRLHNKMLASGSACEILSAFLLPEGVEKWSSDVSKRTQDHLENLNTEEDRLKVNQLAWEAMTGFFKQGLILLLNSLKSLRSLENANEKEKISP